ncbi:MAG: TonB-dependent receptor [Nitrospiraceae bacterium]
MCRSCNYVGVLVFLFVSVFVSVAAQSSVFAQEKAETQSEAEPIVTVETVVISATRTERRLSDLPVSATVLDRQQIKEAPAIAADDILRTIPSLNLPTQSSIVQLPANSTIGFRGLGPATGLFLLDGIPLNDPFFGTAIFHKVVRETLDRVEVIRGGSSSLWGNFAMGGVVNFITKPTDQNAANLDTTYGSNSLIRTNLYAANKISDHFGISLNVNYTDTNGYQVRPAKTRGPVDVRARASVGNAQFKADYRDDKMDWFIRGNYYSRDGNQGTVVSSDSTEWLDFSTGAKWRLDASSDLKASLFAQQREFKIVNPVNVPGTPPRTAEVLGTDQDTPTTDLGGTLQYIKRFGALIPEATVGVDVRQIQIEQLTTFFPPLVTTLTHDKTAGKQFFAGLFGQASIMPMRGLELLPSVRVDFYRNYAGTNRIASGTTNAARNFDENSFVQANPKLAARYQLAEPVAIRAAAYRSFKAPTPGDLYNQFRSPFSAGVQNPFLKPEVLYGGEAGLDVAKGPFKGQVNYFWNEVTDQIQSVVISFAPIQTTQRQNVGKTRSRGVELMGELELTKTLSVLGSYTYTDSRVIDNTADPTLVGKLNPNIPLNFASFTFQYRQPAGLTLALRGRFLGARFNDIQNTPVNKLDSNFILDGSASYLVNKHVEVFMIAENLTNTDYFVDKFGIGRIGAPFQIFGGVKLMAF